MRSIMNFFVVILVTVVTLDELNAEKITKERASITERDTSTREPSVQVYGLPKRVLINNGEMERVHLTTRVVVQDPETPKKPSTLRRGHPLFQSRVDYSVPQHGNVQGHIERFAIQPDVRRAVRSVNEEEEDLQAEESKVFRPLFVYRQQQAQKRRSERSKKTNYGIHQYGSRKSINHAPHYQNEKDFRSNQRPNSLY